MDRYFFGVSKVTAGTHKRHTGVCKLARTRQTRIRSSANSGTAIGRCVIVHRYDSQLRGIYWYPHDAWVFYSRHNLTYTTINGETLRRAVEYSRIGSANSGKRFTISRQKPVKTATEVGKRNCRSRDVLSNVFVSTNRFSRAALAACSGQENSARTLLSFFFLFFSFYSTGCGGTRKNREIVSRTR